MAVLNSHHYMMKEFDVIIVGAGLSGIGAAYHLQRQCPDRSFHIVESRQAIGGTWDLFRYPGIRSDSDMYTLGYEFKPWRGGKVLADGPSIRAYISETADENNISEHISFGQTVSGADWCSQSQRWTLSINDKDQQQQQYRCSVLLLCSGYYSYHQAYTPEFPGRENYQGQFVEPQFWPEQLDYTNKTVVVIGSGATAVTLVPAMAETARRVTMLQRSPTYMVNRPQTEPWQGILKRFLPERIAYAAIRWKNAMLQRMIYAATRIAPSMVKRHFLNAVRKQLGPEYDIDTHFTPDYNPWDQRLCAVPDNDIFAAINSGKADVVTDQIERFTATGIMLKSGRELDADIVVSATGLQLIVNGEINFSKDGEAIDFADTWSYKGMMFSDVPNLISTFGYINASWTLRADLIANFACRLLNEMRDSSTQQVTPSLRDSDASMIAKPWIDDFSSGYMQRSMHLFPKQGDREPWRNTQNYRYEKTSIAKARLDDGALLFS